MVKLDINAAPIIRGTGAVELFGHVLSIYKSSIVEAIHSFI